MCLLHLPVGVAGQMTRRMLRDEDMSTIIDNHADVGHKGRDP